jgi:hypothetical protein
MTGRPSYEGGSAERRKKKISDRRGLLTYKRRGQLPFDWDSTTDITPTKNWRRKRKKDGGAHRNLARDLTGVRSRVCLDGPITPGGSVRRRRPREATRACRGWPGCGAWWSQAEDGGCEDEANDVHVPGTNWGAGEFLECKEKIKEEIKEQEEVRSLLTALRYSRLISRQRRGRLREGGEPGLCLG